MCLRCLDREGTAMMLNPIVPMAEDAIRRNGRWHAQGLQREASICGLSRVNTAGALGRHRADKVGS